MGIVQIANRKIGPGHPPFIVAEAGINHNGELKKALRMVHVAKEAGADAIKFQTFKAAEFVNDSKSTYTYRSRGRVIKESMLRMFKRCEFSSFQWVRVKKECTKVKIMFFSTPQNPSDLDLLLRIGIPAIKVGSDDFTNLPLLKNYTQTKLPMIVSCGMSDKREIKESLDTIGAKRGYPTVLLLCTSQYPTPSVDVHVSRLLSLKQVFPYVVLGFSDHTQGPLASSLALGLGACVFEKHFTLSQRLPGPDHWFSADPGGLKDWVSSLRMAYEMMGSPRLEPTKSEKKMKLIARRSVVTLQIINKGEKLNEENLGLRRPGSGLPPKVYARVLGKKATRNLMAGHLIRPGDYH